MSSLIRRERLRRVVLLCAHFARNLAYYRAGHDRLTRTSLDFWITVDGNFLDMAVIEWCKLLGDGKGKHSWANVATDPPRFKSAMLTQLGVTTDEFAAYVDEMRGYRDKFLAHLDDQRVMRIPLLDRAKAAVEFYHRYVVQNEAAAGDLDRLPKDLADYYGHCFDEAISMLERCNP